MNSHRIETSIPIGLGTLPYNAIAANLPDLKSDQHFWDSELFNEKDDNDENEGGGGGSNDDDDYPGT